MLDKLKLDNVNLIKINDFEDQELLNIKNSRSPREYCWTCTPSLPLYILKKHPEIDMIAYLDADLFFYSSPKPIYQEFGNSSIMIIPHRYSEETKHLEEKNGIYNVGMLIFRNNTHGLRCLNWWRDRCIEWCYATYENGKLGDQLYLNCWPRKFKGVYILQHKGSNLASWNLPNYTIKKTGESILVDDNELIFFHFHGVKIHSETSFKLPAYTLTSYNKNTIYKPYLKELQKIIKQINAIDQTFNFGFTQKRTICKRIILKLKKIIKNN